MSITSITSRMLNADFLTAMNDNVTSFGFTGRSVSFANTMRGHEFKTALLLNGLGVLNFNISGKSYIDSINAAFSSVSITDKVIAGAVDVKTFGAVGNWTTDDTEDIQAAVNAGNVIIQNGTFKITASIKIPSNRTVYLFNCVVKKANASYDNIFCNSDFVNGNVNIYIVGLGNAEINGNCENNGQGSTYTVNGMISPAVPPPYPANCYKNPSLFFCNVNGFEIKNLYLGHIPSWAMCLQKCTYGSIHDIYVAFDTKLYNQDGIDILGGCNNIEIYNLTKNIGDDFSALCVTKYAGFGYVGGVTDWNIGDIHDISYHDICIDQSEIGGLCVPLAGDGKKIYNISFKDIFLRRTFFIHYDNYVTYRDVACAKTDFYNITYENIEIAARNTGAWTKTGTLFYFGNNMMDFDAKNIVIKSGSESLYSLIAGDQSDNVKINGVQVI